MNWRNLRWAGVVGLGTLVLGCDYTPKKPAISSAAEYGSLPSQGRRQVVVAEDPNSERPAEVDPEVVKRREVILASVIKLMETAYIHPGGRNFELATESLNELFDQAANPKDYAHTPDSRDFLSTKVFELTNQDPANVVKGLAAPKWTIRDARHIEDCMLYHAVATRVAGEGDDLTRVRRIFDWTVRNVELVPAGSLALPGVSQAQARPADVIFRGMATEAGNWSERGWVFMSLCRQIGIDAGLLNYTPRRSTSLMATPGSTPAVPPVTWVVAAIVDDKPYLFDQRIGLEIPSLDGNSVATLDDVIAHSEILDRLDLPAQSSLGVSAADLVASPTKITVQVDSSVGYLSTRMRLLQGQLRGQSRTILFRDPGEQARHFVRALGPRIGNVYLWDLPIRVQDLLFSNPDFVAATQASLQFFDGRYPLLVARTNQLRGDLSAATDKYLTLRFAEAPLTVDGKETPIPPDVQKALDVYATYFIAQNHNDQGRTKDAEFVFRQVLNLVPEPGPGRNFYYMLRWGALYNLARLCEARGDVAGAIAFYGQADVSSGMVSPQHHGDLLRARRLVWADPLAEPTTPLAPAPSPPPVIPASIAAPTP